MGPRRLWIWSRTLFSAESSTWVYSLLKREADADLQLHCLRHCSLVLGGVPYAGPQPHKSWCKGMVVAWRQLDAG